MGERRIRITVADSGKGFGAVQLSRIFESFFTTKGELGLWMTEQIVEKHGGAIPGAFECGSVALRDGVFYQSAGVT